MKAFGPYRVVREIGRGGMGAVYEAEREGLPRRLAVKVIHTLAADEESVVRFTREAELLARVRHRNVLVVHDLGRSPEGPYLVTDLVEGESLRARLMRGALDPHEAARLTRELADALVAVHAQGVLHRDLKPENVLVRPDCSPVLLDFGLAREAAGDRMTRTGQLLGTPAYMAPEQITGGGDARLDVYGLGAVLFTALSARPPFTATSHMRVLTKVMTEEPRWPSADRPEVPGDLEAVVVVAMAKDPDDRYPTAAALRDDLDRFLAGRPTEAAAKVPRLVAAAAERRRRRLVAAALPLSVVLLTLVLALVVLRVQLAGPAARAAPAPPALALAPYPALTQARVLALEVRRVPPPEGEPAPDLPLEVHGREQGARAWRLLESGPGDAPLRVEHRLRRGTNALELALRWAGGELGPPVRVEARCWFPDDAGAARLPPLPLPAGLAPTDEEGVYRWARDGSELVWVPPGRVAPGEVGDAARVFAAAVDVGGLFLGRDEVRAGQALAFARAVGRDPARWAHDRPDLPATALDADEAAAYCGWAGLRLPTETEWQWAACADRAWPWGDGEPRPKDAALYFAGVASALRPGPDAGRDVSAWGLRHAAGNVSEWTVDPGAEPGTRRVRGGAWLPLIEPFGPDDLALRAVHPGAVEKTLAQAPAWLAERAARLGLELPPADARARAAALADAYRRPTARLRADWAPATRAAWLGLRVALDPAPAAGPTSGD